MSDLFGLPDLPGPSDRSDTPGFLAIEDWRLRDAAVDARVVCKDVSCMDVGPETARAMLERYPTLAEHACSSHGVRTFGQVIEGTEAPHLVEHLAIDHLVAASRATGGGHQAFAGHTSWLNREQGAMRVTVGVASARRGKRAPVDEATLEGIQAAIRWAVGQVNEVLANR